MSVPHRAILVATIAGHCAAAQLNFLSASSSLVQWQGRTRLNGDGGVAFDWEGTSATLSLSGVGVRLSLLTNITLPASCAGRISVFIDRFHAANMPIHRAVGSYLLGAGLKGEGVRNVTVVYTMEPLNSCSNLTGDEVSFFGFESDGQFLPPPQPLARRIDIIGDSITAGSQFDNEHSAKPVVCNDWLVTNSVWSNWQASDGVAAAVTDPSRIDQFDSHRPLADSRSLTCAATLTLTAPWSPGAAWG